MTNIIDQIAEYTDRLEVGLGRLTALEYEVETRTLDFARKFDEVNRYIEKHVAQFTVIINDLSSQLTIVNDRVDGIFEVAAEQHMWSHEDRLTRAEVAMVMLNDRVGGEQVSAPAPAPSLTPFEAITEAMTNLGYKIVRHAGPGDPYGVKGRWYLDIEPA